MANYSSAFGVIRFNEKLIDARMWDLMEIIIDNSHENLGDFFVMLNKTDEEMVYKFSGVGRWVMTSTLEHWLVWRISELVDLGILIGDALSIALDLIKSLDETVEEGEDLFVVELRDYEPGAGANYELEAGFRAQKDEDGNYLTKLAFYEYHFEEIGMTYESVSEFEEHIFPRTEQGVRDAIQELYAEENYWEDQILLVINDIVREEYSEDYFLYYELESSIETLL